MVEADGPLLVAVSLLVSLYTYYVLRAIPAGRDRFLFALPLIPVLLALPWLFDPEQQPASVALTAWVLTWLGGFKVLSFCFGRGILASEWNSVSLLRFYLSLALPLHIRPIPKAASGPQHSTANHSGDEGSSREDAELRRGAVTKEGAAKASDRLDADSSQLASARQTDGQVVGKGRGSQGKTPAKPSQLGDVPTGGLAGALLSSAVHGVLFYFNLQLYSIPSLPLMAVELVHCLSILLFLTAICDAVAALAKVLAGLEIQPYFNKPYLARSFGDFWARRWNITVSSCLRNAVYEPVEEFLDNSNNQQRTFATDHDTERRYAAAGGGAAQQLTPVNGNHKQGSGASWKAKASGTLATFFVSGVMHELIVYYVTREVTGEMIVFFCLHGTFVTAESVLRGKGLLRGVPAPVSVPFVVGTTLLTAHLLFFPPFIRSAATHKVIRQVKGWLGQTS